MQFRFVRWFVMAGVLWAAGCAMPAVAQPSPVAAPLAVQHAPAHSFELFPANVASFRLLNGHFTPALDTFFRYLGQYAGRGEALPPLVLVLVLLGVRRANKLAPDAPGRARGMFLAVLAYRPLALLLLAVAVEAVLVSVLKGIFHQPRPQLLLADVHTVVKLSWGSFPSGDAAQAGVTACALWQSAARRGWWRLLLVLYVLFVCYERIYIGVHFPLDVLTGATLGVGIGLATAYFLDRRPTTTETASASNVPVL